MLLKNVNPIAICQLSPPYVLAEILSLPILEHLFLCTFIPVADSIIELLRLDGTFCHLSVAACCSKQKCLYIFKGDGDKVSTEDISQSFPPAECFDIYSLRSFLVVKTNRNQHSRVYQLNKHWSLLAPPSFPPGRRQGVAILLPHSAPDRESVGCFLVECILFVFTYDNHFD